MKTARKNDPEKYGLAEGNSKSFSGDENRIWVVVQDKVKCNADGKNSWRTVGGVSAGRRRKSLVPIM